ncbi:MAG: FliM/FliN family flagellar motor switch protein [Planctomycetes bacterium]|nr:FliM/FliN family flagellar motor switch protein [Planctomycetota bacterium]
MAEPSTPKASPAQESPDATVVMDDSKTAAPRNGKAPQAGPADQQTVEVSQAELPEAPDAPKGQAVGQLEVLLETAMPISACLGEVEMEVRELLDLGVNSVVRLNRHVGEPVDLTLRGVKFAKGHVVVIGEQIGVRISEILAGPEAKPPGK